MRLLLRQHTGQHALSRGFQGGAPKVGIDVELAAATRHQLQRQVHVAVLDLAHHHVGAPGHGRMDGVLAQEAAVDLVVGRGRHGTDDVAGVDVFECVGDAACVHIPLDLRAQQVGHIAQQQIARGVSGTGAVQQMLASAFGRHDDGMMAALQAFFQRGQQAAFPFEGEGRFRYQDKVHFLHGQRGLGGDEA